MIIGEHSLFKSCQIPCASERSVDCIYVRAFVQPFCHTDVRRSEKRNASVYYLVQPCPLYQGYEVGSLTGLKIRRPLELLLASQIHGTTMSPPSGGDVYTTLHDVASTLMQCCLNVAFPAGQLTQFCFIFCQSTNYMYIFNKEKYNVLRNKLPINISKDTYFFSDLLRTLKLKRNRYNINRNSPNGHATFIQRCINASTLIQRCINGMCRLRIRLKNSTREVTKFHLIFSTALLFSPHFGTHVQNCLYICAFGQDLTQRARNVSDNVMLYRR